MCVDQFIVEFDLVLRTVFASAKSLRPVPGADLPGDLLSKDEVRNARGLMRINHSGEVCAQALYQGQALTSSNLLITSALRHAASEETEHLAWTEQRLFELGGRKSLLNPALYLGSLVLGITVGRFGDKWSLGFLAETERQVEAHLDSHLNLLSLHDTRSRRVVEQMRLDEIKHAEVALSLGAAKLPMPVKGLMKVFARLMTVATYRV